MSEETKEVLRKFAQSYTIRAKACRNASNSQLSSHIEKLEHAARADLYEGLARELKITADGDSFSFTVDRIGDTHESQAS